MTDSQRLGDLANDSSSYGNCWHNLPLAQRQKAMADIWQEAIGLQSQPGLDEDYFALGGDSMTSVIVAASAKRELGLSFRATAIPRHPTIRRLLEFLEKDKHPIQLLETQRQSSGECSKLTEGAKEVVSSDAATSFPFALLSSEEREHVNHRFPH